MVAARVAAIRSCLLLFPFAARAKAFLAFHPSFEVAASPMDIPKTGILRPTLSPAALISDSSPLIAFLRFSQSPRGRMLIVVLVDGKQKTQKTITLFNSAYGLFSIPIPRSAIRNPHFLLAIFAASGRTAKSNRLPPFHTPHFFP